MAIYNKAEKRLVGWANNRDDNTDATIVVVHLTASEAQSQYDYFNRSRSACSNFHIARNGHVEQYIDTRKISAAEYEGSDDAISIETQGADANGRWDKEQAEELAQLLAWIHKTHGLPLRLKTTSRPEERGIGWHRLGISGNFPTSPEILRGRNQRGYAGERWSSSFGKVCPGDNRILQLRDEVLPRARKIAKLGSDDNGGDNSPRPVWRGAMGWVKLRPGAGGDEVEELQKFLNKNGAKLDIDGKFGPKTEDAVRAWQKKAGLASDGIVGSNTQKAMDKGGVKTKPKPKPKPKPTPSDKNDIVVDGKWGPATTKKLQKVLGAPDVDGKISRQNSRWKSQNPGLKGGWEWDGDRRDGGSQTIRRLQGRIGVPQDGKWGAETARGLQRYLATPIDGVTSDPSTMVKALQRRLNKGRL